MYEYVRRVRDYTLTDHFGGFGGGEGVVRRGNFTATAASSLVARTPPFKARSPPRREAVANRLPNVSVPPRSCPGQGGALPKTR